ncbi:hypothetical protein J7T55_015260 [Diaporthe amygdali]|uniref:uncharacterized protein n=1 Tax=Phomopsis amygdali TaxID=1214568 RepID=UPI0022FEE98C|nr:uncharacterized protein J7T55_015260 [Diaporthe amygdali]KAJ0120531.1 hypothetical protein J7T55_015260 [Diaporthe amygdali]
MIQYFSAGASGRENEKQKTRDRPNTVMDCIVVRPEPERRSCAQSNAGSNESNSLASGAIPIAICGIGMRLPGGLDTPSALYDFLAAGKDARAQPDDERFSSKFHYFRDLDGNSQPLPTREGYWLSNKDVTAYDPSLFLTSHKEAVKMDPLQHLLLQVSWEAFESAAEKDWEDENASMTLWTACSAAGLAVHLACQGIRAGDCDTHLSPVGFTRLMAEQGVLSPDTSYKTFDAEANGYARANATSCLFIKRLDHALRDGNPVRAIIRGSATNSDGKKAGLTTPSPQAQEQVIRAAYRQAGIDDADVCRTAFVQCHGTGTAVGDMVEGCSVGAVFGDKGIHIGSVKPNLGHSEGASALTSIIKSVVALERRTILPNIKFKSPNTRNSAASFMAGTSPRPAPSPYSPPPSPPPGQQGASLLVLSAGSEKSLKMMIEQYMDYLQRHPTALDRLAYTLAHGRPVLPFRTFCVAQQPDDLHTSMWPIIRPVAGSNRAVFVFTGQGAQWPRMGAELLKTSREFREDIRPDSHEDVDAAQGPISYFKGIRLSPVESLENGGQGGGTSHGAIELVWKPDVDLISPSALVQRAATKEFQDIHSYLQELFTLCALDLQEGLPPASVLGLGPSTVDSNLHLAKQYEWLKSYTPEQGMISGLGSGQVAGRIDSLARQLEGTSAAAAARLVVQCHAHARALFNGDASPLDLFLQDNSLHHLYDWMNSIWSYRCLLQLLSHQRGRNLKILEIGAGTGGLTSRVLPDLREEEEAEETDRKTSTIEEKAMFGKYVFTDVSAGFFPAAKKRFAAVVPPQSMEYRVLDISRSPQEQGFGTGEYDLVIASNVLHATPDLTQTLRHVRSLLRPDGRLLLQELACGVESKWINFIMGFLPGWWLGQADARANEPYLAPEDWCGRLVDAGFDAPELVALDADAPLQLNATMLARPAPVAADRAAEADAVNSPPSVTLLVPPESEGAADGLPAVVWALEERLVGRGHLVSRVSIGQPLNLPVAASQRHVVVSAIDLCLQDGWFYDLTGEKLASFQRLIGELQAANVSMLWLTQLCQIRPSNPSFAQCLGVARTVRAELGVRFGTLELDLADSREGNDAALRLEHVSRALESFIQKGRIADSQASDGLPDQDMEMAYCSVAKAIMIPRARPVSIRSAIHSSAINGAAGCAAITTLRAVRPGSLESLQWTTVPRAKCHPPSTTPLPSGAVRVRVEAAGLNFKDVMVAMGLLEVPGSGDAQTQGLPLGCEAAGVVTAVGASASSKSLSIGDRVAVFAPQAGCFSTEVEVDARLCARIPDGLSMSEAAGMPCVFTTILRGLADKAGAGPGQTVLIHSGSGGVGLAALQVAQHLGVAPADIYATAGSDEKRAFLAERCGLPPANVFSSRDDSFVDGVMAVTRGRGVDVVLNSLSGDLLHASWGCVAAGGTLVELGKRDVVAHARLAMAPFDDNRSFVAVDMARLAVQDPSVVGRLLQRTLDLYKQGAVTPVQPLRIFGCDEVEDAFRHLSKPSHVGKVVVNMTHCQSLRPNPKNVVPWSASVPMPAPELDPEAVYLLVGGFGGLGLSISRWMASHGAKSLATLSRSGGKNEAARDVLAELLEMDCKVMTLACDVTNEDAVREAVSHVSSSTQRRIAGVLFLPMVLADAALPDMTIGRWQAATDPKVRGAWNIHNALPQSSHLDFFVLFGSTSGFCGYPGQANYAAANSFLDAFAQYRRELGLPCSVVDLGPVEDVGHVSNSKEIQDTMARSGARFVSERHMLEAVQLAMLRSTATPSQDQVRAIDRGLLIQGQLGVGFDVQIPLEDARNSVVWKRDARMVTLCPGGPGPQSPTAEPGPSSNGLADFILHLRSDPTGLDSPSSSTLIAREIASRLFGLLSRELDPADEVLLASVSLASLGIDSLITIEVRNWWKRTFGSQISSMQLINANNFMQLASLAITQFKLREAIAK